MRESDGVQTCALPICFPVTIAAHYERMKRAGETEEGSTDQEINKFKAQQNWEKVDKKTHDHGAHDLIRTASTGRDILNKARAKREAEDSYKDANSWKNVGREALHGRKSVAAGVAVAKGITAASKFAKKIFNMKEEEQVEEGIASTVTKYAKDIVSGALNKGNNSDDNADDSNDKSTSTSKGRRDIDATKEKTAKEIAFGGSDKVQTNNPFERAKKNRSDAEDRRLERIQKAANRAMSGTSTAISETVFDTIKRIMDTGISENVNHSDGSILVYPRTAIS